MIPRAPAALLYKLRALHPKLHADQAPASWPSPCISVCRMDGAQNYCLGCLRTLQELRDWGRSDAATQRTIWLRIAQRAQPAP